MTIAPAASTAALLLIAALLNLLRYGLLLLRLLRLWLLPNGLERLRLLLLRRPRLRIRLVAWRALIAARLSAVTSLCAFAARRRVLAWTLVAAALALAFAASLLVATDWSRATIRALGPVVAAWLRLRMRRRDRQIVGRFHAALAAPEPA